VILRSLWEGGSGWSRMLKQASTSSADGLLLPLAQNLLGGKGILSRAPRLCANRSKRCGSASMWAAPIAARSGYRHRGAPRRTKAPSENQRRLNPLDELILALFDIGCLLFGRLRPGSVPSSINYIDLRQINLRSELVSPGAACLCRPA